MPRSTACCATTSFKNQLVVRAVEAARGASSTRASCAPTGRTGWSASLDGLLREFEYQIDADRFLRIVNRDSEDPESLGRRGPAVRQADRGGSPSTRGSTPPTRRSSPPSMRAARTSSWRWSSPTSLAARLISRASFSQETASGCCSRRRRMTASSRATARSSAHRSWWIDHAHEAFRWQEPAAGSKAAFYDANGRSLKRFMLRSPLKFEPRVTSGFSTPSHAPDRSRVASASRRRLRGADRRSGCRGCGRHGGVGRVQRRERQPRAPETSARYRDATISTCRPSARASMPARTSNRDRSSEGSERRVPRPARTSITA